MDIEVLRGVVEAARMWRHNHSGMNITVEDRALMDSIDAMETALGNRPIGFVVRRTWAEVPAGWFVRTPRQEWWEVCGSYAEGGKQVVSLRSPDGKIGTFPRTPNAEVSARKGSAHAEMAAALAIFAQTFDGASIIESTEGIEEAK